MGRRGLTSCPALFCKLLTLHKDLAQIISSSLASHLRKKINCPQLIFAPIALCTKLCIAIMHLPHSLLFICLCVCLFPQEYAPSRQRSDLLSCIPSTQQYADMSTKTCLRIFSSKEMHAHVKNSKQHGLVQKKGQKLPFYHPDHQSYSPMGSKRFFKKAINTTCTSSTAFTPTPASIFASKAVQQPKMGRCQV